MAKAKKKNPRFSVIINTEKPSAFMSFTSLSAGEAKSAIDAYAGPKTDVTVEITAEGYKESLALLDKFL